MPDHEQAAAARGAARVGAGAAGRERARKQEPGINDPFIRAENEDDDGYDPYSDRRPEREPLFERDPWG